MTPEPGAAVRQWREHLLPRRQPQQAQHRARSTRCRGPAAGAERWPSRPTCWWRTSGPAPWPASAWTSPRFARPTRRWCTAVSRRSVPSGARTGRLRPAGPGAGRADERHRVGCRHPTKVGVAAGRCPGGFVRHGRHPWPRCMERDRTGRGQHVEINLMSVLSCAWPTNRPVTFWRARFHGRWAMVMPASPRTTRTRPETGRSCLAWETINNSSRSATSWESPSLRADQRFLHQRTTGAATESRCATVWNVRCAATRRHTGRGCYRVGIPAGAVNNIAEAFAFADELGPNPFAAPKSATVRSAARLPARSICPPRR